MENRVLKFLIKSLETRQHRHYWLFRWCKGSYGKKLFGLFGQNIEKPLYVSWKKKIKEFGDSVSPLAARRGISGKPVLIGVARGVTKVDGSDFLSSQDSYSFPRISSYLEWIYEKN